MTEIIKAEVLVIIKQMQTSCPTEVDIVDFWFKIQTQVFLSVAIMKPNATKLFCAYENENGKIENVNLAEMI